MSYDQNFSAKRVALRDITEHLQSQTEYWEKRGYIVGAGNLDTKETRWLNKLLGVSKINYFK